MAAWRTARGPQRCPGLEAGLRGGVHAQVAKALLDSAPRGGGGAVPPPPARAADAWAPESVLALLRFREAALTAEIAAAMGAAARAAAPRGKKAAAAAGNDAYEAALDRVLALGWAHVDRIAFEVRAHGKTL